METELNEGVRTATISNPPINVMTPTLFTDLMAFSEEVEKDGAVQVVVFESADPDFFIAHFDVETLIEVPTNEPAARAAVLNPFHVMCERARTMPKATIAKIAGRAGGGGSEFALSCDMRFGIYGKTIINQMEVALGILPGGTGTQRLPRLLGRGRAMEVVLGSDDLDAETAEKWGYLNRAFDTAKELDAFVDRLARRIASWPADAVRLAKESVNNAEKPLNEGLLDEAYLFQQSLRTEGAKRGMRKAIELGAQTRETEMRMGDFCIEVAQAVKDE
ncbi:MAG: enoyl-CoA hydratase/isomerase family protein [Pseudomonadales bacterium]|nr:enoyl-CoA hydratase/isomerase family protein [Pseudomonadales bacterium]